MRMIDILNHGLERLVAHLLVNKINPVRHGFIETQSSRRRFNEFSGFERLFVPSVLVPVKTVFRSRDFYKLLPFDSS